MPYPTQLDPQVMQRLIEATQNYRPGETDQPYWQDPETGVGYFGRLQQGVYGGEGSTPTYTLDGYSVGNFDAAHGGDLGVYDEQGKYTGNNEHWDADDWNWDKYAQALAAAGIAGFAAMVPGGTGALGAANGSWDVLPEAIGSSNPGALTTAFNPAMDSQLANTLIEQGAPGFEQFGGDALSGYTEAAMPSVDASTFTNTDSVFNPAQDSQLANEAIEARAPGFEQFNGDALSGYTSAGIPSVNIGGNVASDWLSSLTKGVSNISAADAVKLITAAVGATGGATGGSNGGTNTGGETEDTTPFDYGPARYLPPGWRSDRPMYVPGLEAVPDGWYGAGYSQG